MSGGVGERFWPVSRKKYPKQFSNIIGNESLFQKCALRVSNNNFFKFSNPVVMTNIDYRFIVGQQLKEISIEPETIIIEPILKDTAASILAAALIIKRIDPASVMLVCPSDHLIPDNEAIEEAFYEGLNEAIVGNIITFGAIPNRPETGYGYLKFNGMVDGSAIPLEKFVEKPTKANAKEMLKTNSYLWNMGIFMAKVSTIIEAFEMYCPELILPVMESIKHGKKEMDFFNLSARHWEHCKKISIDFGVMEYAKNLMVVPFKGKWSDLGDWKSFYLNQKADCNGMVNINGAIGLNCKDSILYSETENQMLVGLGLENIMAVSMKDTVFVANLDQAQEVKEIVELLRKADLKQANNFSKIFRPWGSYEVLTQFESFQVRAINVLPNQSLRLKPNKFNGANWVILYGTGNLTVGSNTKYFSEGQSIYLPAGKARGISCVGSDPLTLVEITTEPEFEEINLI